MLLFVAHHIAKPLYQFKIDRLNCKKQFHDFEKFRMLKMDFNRKYLKK